MDATRVNLDLVKNGEVWGLVAQPLYEETKGSAELLYKMANGEEGPLLDRARRPAGHRGQHRCLLCDS